MARAVKNTMQKSFTSMEKSVSLAHVSVFLSLRFNGHFPGEAGLVSFFEAKDDGNVGDNWSYKTCKAPVKSSPTTKTKPNLLQAGCPSCRPFNSVRALKGKCVSIIVQ